jgi:ACT domain-containing protein
VAGARRRRFATFQYEFNDSSRRGDAVPVGYNDVDETTTDGRRMAIANDESKSRAIITVLGSDRSGIVAEVAGTLARHDANILDISQTILQGIFTMTMLVDMSASDADFQTVQSELNDLAEELGVQITLQREEVFKFMYRL